MASPAGGVSETITLSDLPATKQAEYQRYLGPTADQALNPFPNAVEQNIREKNICERVKTAKYRDLYYQAYGEDIDCSPKPRDAPAYRASFKRVAVALAAYQASTDVNSFTSRRMRSSPRTATEDSRWTVSRIRRIWATTCSMVSRRP